MESHFNRSLSAVNTPQITLRDTPNHLRIGREDDYLEQEANSMANIEIHPPIEQIERHNLSNVRIHSDAMAAESARTIHAAAYSVGHNIVFGPGQYEPNSSIGKKLLAHELAHVIQYEHSANLMDPEENITRRTHSSNDLSVIHRRVAECGYQASQLIEEGGKQSDSSQVPAPPRGLADKDYEEISEELHNAMAGLGTDEEGVYFALNRLKRDPKAIDLLMKKYEAKYKINLLEQIYDEFSGTELEYALQLLNAGKKGSAQEVKDATPTSEENWKNAADRLNKAFEGWGTDEEAVYAVLTPFHRKMELLVKIKLRAATPP